MDAEDVDAVTPGFGRQVLCELHDCGLGDRVSRYLRPAEDAGLAGDVDDASAVTGYHSGKRRSAADEDAAEVDLKRAPPQFRVDLPGRADRAAYCGVVDQQVRRPKLPLQLGEGVRGLVLVTDVRGGGRGHASGGADVLGSRGQLIGRAGDQA